MDDLATDTRGNEYLEVELLGGQVGSSKLDVRIQSPPCEESAKHHHRRLIGAKREVTPEEWARIRQEYYSEHHTIREIAREEGIRRTIVRAVVCPWD
jgi:hypothetical protein